MAGPSPEVRMLIRSPGRGAESGQSARCRPELLRGGVFDLRHLMTGRTRAPGQAVGIARRRSLVSGGRLRQAIALRLARERCLLPLVTEPAEELLGPELGGRQGTSSVFGAVVDRILARLGHAT